MTDSPHLTFAVAPEEQIHVWRARDGQLYGIEGRTPNHEYDGVPINLRDGAGFTQEDIDMIWDLAGSSNGAYGDDPDHLIARIAALLPPAPPETP